MALLEIERKFLVASLSDCLRGATSSLHIAQGYISRDPARTVRVRIKGSRGFLTIKGLTHGCSRFEWEKEIPLEEAEALLELCEGAVIDKTRYLVPWGGAQGCGAEACGGGEAQGCGRVFEVDVFHGAHEGLVIAEIELGSEDEAFERPSWLGLEVTGDLRYYNSNL